MKIPLKLLKMIAALMLCITCSGCITAAVLMLCFGGAALIAASSGGSKNQATNESERYLFSKVNSGVVSSDVKLNYRYRILASRVYKTARHKHYNDDYLNSLSQENDGQVIFPELEAMYPGVFFSGAGSIGIVVELRVKNVYAHECAKYFTSLEADVIVKDAVNGDILGADGFVEEMGWCQSYTNNCQDVTEFQTFRAEDEVASGGDDVFRHAIFEGYAGAVVASLEKFENGGSRVQRPGTAGGARYIEVAEQKSGVAPLQETEIQEDHTAEAVNFFLGTMGSINSMNQAQHARQAARLQARRAARQPAVTGAVSGMRTSTSSVILPKVCPVCAGSRRCRVCNGQGRIASIDAIAADSTSGTVIAAPRATAVMAASRGSCKACGGSGDCRACHGTGQK